LPNGTPKEPFGLRQREKSTKPKADYLPTRETNI